MSAGLDTTVDKATIQNPLGIVGISFIEFAGEPVTTFHQTFKALGFKKAAQGTVRQVSVYQQNRIYFLVNQTPNSYAAQFSHQHGLSAPSIGLRVQETTQAYEKAVAAGAKPYQGDNTYPWPAVIGVGGSLIYFVDGSETDWLSDGFESIEDPNPGKPAGFQFIDHLTNNVEKGEMDRWVDFYVDIFGFTKIQYFDIRGIKTGLNSFALKSPCGTFSIPINEATEEKSQIAEYIREYNGAGIQHIALSTDNLLTTLDQLEGSGIQTLDIHPNYYEEAFQRVPQVTEDKDHIKRHKVLIDGDEDGYLLQIFTQNQFGPIFFEFIQRKNHHAFGEGNFGALFQSIERDQERRGVL